MERVWVKVEGRKREWKPSRAWVRCPFCEKRIELMWDPEVPEYRVISDWCEHWGWVWDGYDEMLFERD